MISGFTSRSSFRPMPNFGTPRLASSLYLAISCLASEPRTPSPKTFKPVLSTTRWTGPDVVARDFVDGNASPLLRRDMVEKSGTAISNPISATTLRIKPLVWRSASP